MVARACFFICAVVTKYFDVEVVCTATITTVVNFIIYYFTLCSVQLLALNILRVICFIRLHNEKGGGWGVGGVGGGGGWGATFI